MAGVTNPPFRNRLRRNGCRYLFTEMISASALARGNRKTLELLGPPDRGTDLAVQIFGADPAELAAAAERAQEAGFRHLDFNMGCPVRKVVRTGAGAALLRDLPKAERCLRTLRERVAGVLSVKMRTGWDAATVCAAEAARMAEACGVDVVVIHGRTRAQGYGGRADWGLIARVARLVTVPVVGNGDLRSDTEAVALLRDSGCAGVMIGRASLSAPWIFAQAEARWAGRPVPPAPGLAAMGEDLVRQMEDMLSLKPERVTVAEMRKFVAWASRGVRGASAFRREIQRIARAGEMAQAIRRFFSEEREREAA